MPFRSIISGLLSLGWLVACSPVEQLHKETTRKPEFSKEHIITSDDHVLPLRVWAPAEPEQPTAAIIALHGFNDYSYAFRVPGEYMAKRGIAVFAYDQRGFGKTKEHGIWGGKENLMRDAVDVVNVVKNRYPNIPVYLLGESMGGAVVVSTLATYPDLPVDGAILTAPALWGNETMNGFYRITLWMMAHTFPGMELTGSGLKIQASDNIEILREMGRDPNIIKSTRVDAIYGVVSLMDYAYTSLPLVKKPLMLLYGANDQVIPKEPVRKAIGLFEQPVKVVYYPTGYHMLLRDLKGEIVLNDIVSWIKYPTGPSPSGYDQNWEERFKE